jgi:Tol biopolymer transport system component
VDIFGVDGRLERRLHVPVSVLNLSWSQDGTRIYFAGNLNDSTVKLYSVEADGSGLRKLRSVPVGDPWNETVEWSPDQSGVAYEAVTHRSLNVYVENPIGSRPRLVVLHPACPGCSLVRWSPDGTRLMYSDNVGVWTVDAHGNHRTLVYRWPLGPKATHSAEAVLWSPDGRWILVTRGTNWGERAFVMRSDGTGLTQAVSGRVGVVTWQGLQR